MEQLIKQDSVAMGMLGIQAIREQVYRPLTYVLTAEESDKRIYYNLLTHEMIAVDLSELESPEIRKYFIENWYLVPERHDDQQLVDECRAVLTLMDSRPKKINAFQIFTTLNCNARCFYCFEKRVSGSNMMLETASRVIEYMKEQAEGEPIKIIWFGGEPLLNVPIIDFISAGLREQGLQYEAKMISNGFLFDSAIIEKAKNLWNMKSVQITLDGTRWVYKRIKAYETNVEDPLESVLQNIKSLLGAGIRVIIRMNIGLHNYSDLCDLVDFLCEEFKEYQNLNIYVSPLYEIKEYPEDKREFLYDLLDELNSKLNQIFGEKGKKDFTGTIVNAYCMASGRTAVTILPDGKVGICPNVVYDVLLGDIYTKEIDIKVREDFGRRFYKEEKCRCCPLYPNCYFVNGCPNKDNKEGCDPIKIQRQIRKIQERMKTRCRVDASQNDERTVNK